MTLLEEEICAQLVQVEAPRVRNELKKVVHGWLSRESVQDLHSIRVLLDRNCAFFVRFLRLICVIHLLLYVAKRALFAIDKDAGKLTPLCLGHFVPWLLLHQVKDFISHIEHQIDNCRSNFDIDFTLSHLIQLFYGLILLSLIFNLDFTLSFSTLSLNPGLFFHLFIFSIPLRLDLQSFSASLIGQYLLAFGLAFSSVGCILLLFLLFEQLLNQLVLLLLLGKECLGLGLVNGKLSTPAFTFLSCEIALLFGLFDLIHGGWEGKVLYLPRRYASLLLLLLDSIIDVRDGLDSEFL